MRIGGGEHCVPLPWTEFRSRNGALFRDSKLIWGHRGSNNLVRTSAKCCVKDHWPTIMPKCVWTHSENKFVFGIIEPSTVRSDREPCATVPKPSLGNYLDVVTSSRYGVQQLSTGYGSTHSPDSRAHESRVNLLTYSKSLPAPVLCYTSWRDTGTWTTT